MATSEKEISYTSTNTYSTLNTLDINTKRVWIVCHGLGYLSRYFINYFKALNPEENYIIAPQAPSKYYQDKRFKYVGACWLTKEETNREITNISNYIASVIKNENIPNDKEIILFGYSQGVSVALRSLSRLQLKCDQLIMHSGGIPKELKTEDFNSYKGKTTLIYGTKDEYLDEGRIEYEISRAVELFGSSVNVIPFDGKHVVSTEIINRL